MARPVVESGDQPSGFALLEAVVAVVVLAVLVGLSVPLYLGYLADRSLQHAAHLIQADLRLAQQAAVSRAGSGPRVEVCFRQNGYDIYAVDYVDPVEQNPAQVRVGATIKVANAGQEYAAGINVAVPPAAAGPCQIDAARRAVIFAGSGAPQSLGGASPQAVTLTLGGRSYRVTIAPMTGRLTVGR
ncbi:MAG: GspH/FimT family pseudopilin [Armatimonadota bacterium]|nr:GspH/FimT family pseudopilin [Armatimonadota bacterium]MDR7550663.1 GspH/FimT family pseudopilin [Armatimonadota bacterium]